MIYAETTLTDTMAKTVFSKAGEADVVLEFREVSPAEWVIQIDCMIVAIPREAIKDIHNALGHVLSLRKTTHHLSKKDT